MTKVSVIIPVYNSKNYLKECLNSILNQTLDDIEVICVNDCSKDNSLSILQKYASKDKRIKIIDLPQNKGAGSARNIGIDNARGEYIGFVDSDDLIDSHFYEKLYKKATETDADVAKGNIYNYYGEINQSKLTDFYDMNDKIRENKFCFYYGFTSAIYKKSFIDKFYIRFPEGLNYFEDPYFSIKACINYEKLAFDDSAKYFYRKHEQSLSSNHLTKNNFRDFHSSSLDIMKLLDDNTISKDNYLVILNFLLDFLTSNFYNHKIEPELRKYILDIIVELVFASKYEITIPFDMYVMILQNIRQGKYYGTLLQCYKKYDYLNKNKSLIKILVSYIQSAFLAKSEILTPIHIGRAVEKESTKYGEITDKDIAWLHENCIGDDDFENNISYLNRRVGFFTGTYWAWKNYEKLGNPEYFGSFGYRRFFFPNFLNDLENYDLILPKKKIFVETIKAQMIKWHGDFAYEAMIDAVKNIIPSEVNDVIDFFDGISSHLLEIYVLKKELFFDYCNWVYKFLEFFVNKYPNKKITPEIDIDKRDIAFLIERLSGYYFYKLTKNTNLKYKEVYLFEPNFGQIKPIGNENKKILSMLREKVKKDFKNG